MAVDIFGTSFEEDLTDIYETLDTNAQVDTQTQDALAAEILARQEADAQEAAARAAAITELAGNLNLITYYVHDQGVPASVWTITHNLGFYPNVEVFDSAGNEAEGVVKHIDSNTLTITFYSGNGLTTFGGVAYLS